MRLSSSSQLIVTLIGPRGDSCSSSMTAAMPAVAACLFSKNHVLSPARLSSSVLRKTPIAELDRTFSYSTQSTRERAAMGAERGRAIDIGDVGVGKDTG